MKVLLISNFYYDRGGDCTYLFSLKKLLEEKGHKVIVFSMRHPRNFNSDYSRYFVSYINYEEEIQHIDISSSLRVLKRTIYSHEAKKKIEELIRDEKPDIAHLQNIHHHITPSIFYPLKKYKVPIVWTLHDYTLICPNTSLLSHGRICEKCKKRKYFWPIIDRCKKDSLSASTMAAIETAMHRIMKTNDLVDVFIAPSEFLRKKIIEYGFRKEKIICLSNFANIDLANEDEKIDNYFIYSGRISEEKGLKTLIDAVFKVFNDKNINFNKLKTSKLKIVGDGPINDELIAYVNSKYLNNKIEFLGYKKHDEAVKIMRGGSFVVLPSEWYENYPYTIIEAFASSKPVIGSRIGGVPEIIKNWETGLLFEPGNSDELSLKIKFFINHPDKAIEMGKSARMFLEQELNPENHYKKLMEIYKQLLS